MENNNLEELLVLYALGELEPDEALAVEEELQKRPELAAQVDKIRLADGLLSDVFTLSDNAAQEELEKETAKPKVAGKETSHSRLAYRLAYSVAALALIVVVGALLYPQTGGKDVQVAMSSNEDAIKSTNVENSTVEKPAVETPSVENLSTNELASAIEENAPWKDAPLFVMKSLDPAQEATQEAATTPEAAANDEDLTAAVPNASSPTPILAEDDDPSEPSPLALAAEMDGSRPNAFYSPIMRAAPSARACPQTNEDIAISAFEHANSAFEHMTLNQMNKRLETQRNVQKEKGASEQNIQTGSFDDDEVPPPGSYVLLQKSVMEDEQLPNPERVKVEQWLNYFGVAELVNTTEDKPEGADNKDVQFAKAMNQFATLLSSSDPAEVKAFEEVLDLLKDSVGDDAKRLKFKAIVEKTIEIVKRSE